MTVTQDDLEKELFPGVNSTYGTKNEYLIWSSTVVEDNSSITAETNPFEATKYKRNLCLTKTNTMKLNKVKQLSDKTLTIMKSWKIDELKGITLLQSNKISFEFNKPSVFYTESYEQTINIIFTFITTFQNYMKNTKLVLNNITEKEVIDIVKQNAKEKAGSKIIKEESKEINNYSKEEDKFDIQKLFESFNWEVNDPAELEDILESELKALEAANVYALLEGERKNKEIMSHIDSGLVEMDTIDSMLNTYATQLNLISEEIQQIETLNKGLQIHIANQQKLDMVLDDFLLKLYIPDDILTSLENESLETDQGILNLEETTIVLRDTLNTTFASGLQGLAAVTERMELYRTSAFQFSNRLFDCLKRHIKTLIDQAMQEKRFSKKGQLRMLAHDFAYEKFSKYRRLILWLRDIEPRRHLDLQVLYQSEFNTLYKKEVRDLLEALRVYHLSKREDDEALRSWNSNSFNSDLGVEKPIEIGPEDKVPLDIALKLVFNCIFPIILKERNFCINLFHAESDNNIAIRNEELKSIKVSKRVNSLLEGLFEGTKADIDSFIDSCLKIDNTFCISMLVEVENEIKKEKGVDLITEILESIKAKLISSYDKFLDEQVSAIENKRSGILHTIRVFPLYVDRMESILGKSNESSRELVNKSYERFGKAIFVHLEAVVKSIDSFEEKEQLNIHILNIENHHHLFTRLRASSKAYSIEKFVKDSKAIYDQHLSIYCKTLIKKNIGKLIEFFDGVNDVVRLNSAEEVTFHVNYNKANAKKVISQYPLKLLENLYKKVDKHFSDDEGLIPVVWRHIQDELLTKYKTMSDLISRCYPDSDLSLNFSISDILNIFTELATK
ncbi:Exocyst complex, component Exoc1 domain-containing protein [Rozella allomycis CSF55]|uniref:Exocyst complex, component Exoc1 domain-containing protein n=1 Tax=Rozella allomycis (strain CSF55) TaxID=988480 RepID=A0A075B2P9_ROZAC|nr:Exocyst complex, component Exoc1 domain-containing protein [Rozella allomycis CSF55]|eukprot:EPZ36592.1 Exocyst complex, component Exoc1 domain-containing protein [Rozella allomycis CSF55]